MECKYNFYFGLGQKKTLEEGKEATDVLPNVLIVSGSSQGYGLSHIWVHMISSYLLDA